MALAYLCIVLLAILAYTFIGYPVVVALLARLFPLRCVIDKGCQPRPEGRDAFEPTVTACIPVHNAASFLRDKLESLLALDYPRDKLEILVFSDGSTDDIAAVLRPYVERHPQIVFLSSPDRLGKPARLNEMRARARGEVLLLTDARQTLTPGSLRAMLKRLADPSTGCVSCNLVLKGSAGSAAYWRYERWIRRSESRFRGMVGASGACYVVRKADMPTMPVDTIVDDFWVPMKLRLSGRRLLLSEEAVVYDTAFCDPREFSRKTRTLAGNFQTLVRLPTLNLPFVNPSFFETFSHKHLRLLSPYLAVALFLSTAMVSVGEPLPSTALQAFVQGLFGFQAVAYLVALLGGRVSRLGALARSFVVFNAAAVVGLWRFASGSQEVTW